MSLAREQVLPFAEKNDSLSGLHWGDWSEVEADMRNSRRRCFSDAQRARILA